MCHIYLEDLVPPRVSGTIPLYHPWRLLEGCLSLQSLHWADMGSLDSVDPQPSSDMWHSLDQLDVEVQSIESCTAALTLLLHTGQWLRELNVVLSGDGVGDSEALWQIASQ